MPRENWTREELLLAFNLYCKLPFGQYVACNKEVIRLGGLIGRTPNAVAMKLSNFASLDPYHQQRGVRGLTNVSQADKAIWNEFHQNWTDLAAESEKILAEHATNAEQEFIQDIDAYGGPTATERTVTVRLGQRFFRTTVLANYRECCCICGIPVPNLLIASHIIPWRVREDLRVDPRNGLCLCALHDRAFDAGFLSVDTEYSILLSSALGNYLPNEALSNNFETFDGHQITLPDKFLPEHEFLDYHVREVFRK